ncbi:Integrase (plasmid) [Collimonas arenae]|uniref:Integrase n=1 Tax=Collimonas arenae TaxID=279058 RepID=A0A0A1FHH0_9BURK|nr:phage integrase family protein [Collimonas arenae]AIY44213.1 Integrase [Collimonas arenae]
MAQHTNVVLPPITYTRADYTALRAHCLNIPLAKIAELYYSDDSPQRQAGLERFLLAMRADLIERAISHNPAFAVSLQGARKGGAMTAAALQILIKAADAPPAHPAPGQPLSQWFRPRTVAALQNEQLRTLADLVELVRRRGPGWWRGISRIGAGRAAAIVRWLQRHEHRLGAVPAGRYAAPAPAVLVVLDPARPTQLAPLGQFTVLAALDGSAGINRAAQFCFIAAGNDLEAIGFYLARFEDQPHTQRAYRRELERFMLWSILIARKPLSSLLVDDCEAYKRFLRAPAPHFMGVRAARTSGRWKPFAPEPLHPKSQKQAIIILRNAFTYLVRVRYLGGNPWVVVKDPSVTEEVHAMQIDRALTVAQWDWLIAILSESAEDPANVQERVALAAILLLGDSGLRREEAAGALRAGLSRWNAELWMLRVLGKRNKKRDVPVSLRTVEALRRHWDDRQADFDAAGADQPLLRPVFVPPTASAAARHGPGQAAKGYTADGLAQLVATAVRRIRAELQGGGIDAEVLEQVPVDAFDRATPHAFRHTFGTLATERGMPLDVVQAVLGHASGTTTAIYVRTRQKRMAEEAAKYFLGDVGDGDEQSD